MNEDIDKSVLYQGLNARFTDAGNQVSGMEGSALNHAKRKGQKFVAKAVDCGTACLEFTAFHR